MTIKRGWLAVLLACALLPLLSGCGRGAKDVVVYTSVDEAYSRPVFEAFEAQTGIRVRAVYDLESQKTVGLANRLRAEKQRPQADVFWSGESAAILPLEEDGMVGEVTAFGGRARVLLINTERMPDRAQWPEHLLDLLAYDPGTVAMANPLFGTSAAHAAALYAALGPLEGKRFYEGARKRFVILEGNGAVRDQAAAGRVPMGLTDTDDAFSAVQAGKPVEMVFLDQGDGGLGTLVMPNTAAMTEGAPHPEHAALLLAYLTSRETQRALYEAGWFDLADFPEDIAAPRFDFASLRPMAVPLREIAGCAGQAAADMEALFLQ